MAVLQEAAFSDASGSYLQYLLANSAVAKFIVLSLPLSGSLTQFVPFKIHKEKNRENERHNILFQTWLGRNDKESALVSGRTW